MQRFIRKTLGAFVKGVKKAVANPGRPDAAAGEEDHEAKILRQRAAELRALGLTEREFRESRERPGTVTDLAERRRSVKESLWSGHHEGYYSRWEGRPDR